MTAGTAVKGKSAGKFVSVCEELQFAIVADFGLKIFVVNWHNCAGEDSSYYTNGGLKLGLDMNYGRSHLGHMLKFKYFTILNQLLRTGILPVPQENLSFVEQASCLLLTMVQNVS